MAAIVINPMIFSSCSDFLDKEPDTELDMTNVWEDKIHVEKWLANVYSAIPDNYDDYLFSLGWMIMGDDATIPERYRQYGNKTIPMILGEWTPSSTWDGNYWALLPQRIHEANLFREKAHALPKQDISEQEMTYMKTECRFLQAYYYYLLANTYGPIPFKPDYVWPVNASLSDMMETQTPFEDVIKWCSDEMLACSKILPASYPEARKYGRITSLMCLAMRARMLLFDASPLVNGNPDYTNFMNKKGEHLFSTTYDASKWKVAADACKDLIDKAEATGHKLYVEYADDDKQIIDPFLSYENAFLKREDEGNTEILFARPSVNFQNYEKNATPNASGGNGGFGVTQELVDAFFMENGLPIDNANSNYEETGFSSSDEHHSNTGFEKENGGNITCKGTYNMYCHREPRFYVTVNFNGAYFPSEDRKYNFFNGGTDNNHTHDAPQNGYLMRKRLNPKDNIKQGTYTYRPGIIVRLAEIYLNYIEALNECDPGNTDILTYLNKIRDRAGVRGYTTGATDNSHIHCNLNDQAEMRKLIRAERRVELCAEGTRYDDLRRWKEAETTLTGDFYGMNFDGTNAQNFYQRKAYIHRIYRKAYYWFPIHQSEIDKNPNLIQNPYWNQISN